MTAMRAALAGKRVAVVGTGASAAQIVPAIVDKVWIVLLEGCVASPACGYV
jgi:cation diffusion facilitator CzcD-associated flavoprotein CzcO